MNMTMRTLANIQLLKNFQLLCTFSDGAEKIADLSDYLRSEAFKPLVGEDAFNKVTNQKYFIEWVGYDLDLSADTLWHTAKEVPKVSF
jgi:hypothetical protein